jgi:stage V sporulation protein AD
MKKIGMQTIIMENLPYILETSSIVGPKEAAGPLAKYFDKCLEDEFWGEKTWEKAESKIIKENVNALIAKSGIASSEIDYCFAGDLLNQCISSSFGLRETNLPFFGIFGACSTFVEGLCLGSVFVDSGAAQNVLCATSSHFCSAEKQFRFPLELGNQRPQSAQWTVTGSGAAILSNSNHGKECPRITYVTPGKIVDMGVKDANNMGAAMAPAALDTLVTHFKDTGRKPSYYDAIITGDLGHVGKEILTELAETKGYNIKNNYDDCGVLIFDKENQDTHSGGSGCACIASVFSGYFYQMLKEKKINKVLLMATGALMNSTTSQQGESIPGIAHAVAIENLDN